MNEFFMQRCIELAYNGLGNTYPNPLVGSVIVYDNKIIGEGFHTKAGEPHAEVNAINSVNNKKLLRNSTIYVNLEPCSHYGKTPPCADLIIKNQIPNVVIGTIDPFSKVKGKGVEKLRNAGCNVEVGVLESKCKELNKRFFTFHTKKRPYVILKWAQTVDGFIDILRNKNSKKEINWITNEISKTYVHKWRSEEQAILIGTNTAINDNPKLNVRNWYGKNPVRILIDENLITDKELNIYDETSETIIFNDIKNNFEIENLHYAKIDFKKNVIQQIFDFLYNRNIQSVIVEGGTFLIKSIYKDNLWDEARVLIGDKFFHQGIKAPEIIGEKVAFRKLDESCFYIFKNNSI